MTEKTIHKKWIERVTYDLDTAEAMHKAGRHIYVVFMCQQALEKCLKALLVYQGKKPAPIHNLRRLIEAAGIGQEVDEEAMRKVDFLSQYYLNARYKEDIEELVRQVRSETAREILDFTREEIGWLLRKMTP